MTKKMPSIIGENVKFNSLAEVVSSWRKHFGRGAPHAHRRDTVVDFCAMAGTFAIAVRRACDSRAADGKMHNHQSRVPQAVKDKFTLHITQEAKRISSSNSFDVLYDRLNAIKPEGIGPVTLYDVATRIGAYLKMEPTSLYLHAGVRIGWCILHACRSPSVARIAREDWPKELRVLPADEVEDMLCAYRDYLQPWCANAKL